MIISTIWILWLKYDINKTHVVAGLARRNTCREVLHDDWFPKRSRFLIKSFIPNYHHHHYRNLAISKCHQQPIVSRSRRSFHVA